jgi:hypothetical protein
LKKIVAPLIAIIVVAIVAGVVLLQKPAPVAPPSKPETPTTPSVPKPEVPETPPSKPEVLPEAPRTETPIKVSIRDLLQEYKNNSVAANEKYKDRIIVTEGEVIYIEDKKEGADVWISWPDPYSGARIPYGPAIVCSFSDKEEVIPIKKGEIIAVMGKNKGKGETLVLYFEDSHLRKAEEVKEFKAEFDKETGNLKIQNFGYDLLVKLKSPKGELINVTSVNYFETSVTVEKLPHRIHWISGFTTAGFKDPRPGEYSVIIVEKIKLDDKKYDEKLLYEEKFSVGGPEKSQMKIEIQGKWENYGEAWIYQIEGINITFTNPEKIPIMIETPEVFLYKEGESSPHSFSQWEERRILLAGENTTFILVPFSPPTLTTDTKGGEYQLTLKIRIFDEIKELKVTLKVPPLSA